MNSQLNEKEKSSNKTSKEEEENEEIINKDGDATGNSDTTDLEMNSQPNEKDFKFVRCKEDESSGVKIFQVFEKEEIAASYSKVLDLMGESKEFRSCLTETLNECDYTAYTWEVVPTKQSLLGKTEFKFAVVESNSLKRKANFHTYSEYFEKSQNEYVTSFYNLGRDAMLIAPLPNNDNVGYAHIGCFLASAPEDQIHSFWSEVSKVMKMEIDKKKESPLWLSTAGHGVAWLHVRVDTYPKYYSHEPYTTPPKNEISFNEKGKPFFNSLFGKSK